jgi:hypothetical protein
MQAWTANARAPSADEQNRIDVSVLAGRELNDIGRPETEEWVFGKLLPSVALHSHGPAVTR